MFGQLFRNMPDVVKNLLIINVLFFLAQYIIPIIDNSLPLYPFFSNKFEPWQLASHFFMHDNLSHLFFNMFALVIFGSQLERVWGPKRFLIYYLICAIGAALLYQLVLYIEYKSIIDLISLNDWNVMVNNGDKVISNHVYNEGENKYISFNEWDEEYNFLFTENIYKAYILFSRPMIGASGAVFGLLAAFGYLFPNTQLMLLFPPIPIKAKYFVIGYAALELYLGMANNVGDNVAHFAHLGGALVGILLVLYWQKSKNKFF